MAVETHEPQCVTREENNRTHYALISLGLEAFWMSKRVTKAS